MTTPNDAADVERAFAAFRAAVRDALPSLQTTWGACFDAAERAGLVRRVTSAPTPDGGTTEEAVCEPGAEAYAGITFTLGVLEGLAEDPGTGAPPAPASPPPNADDHDAMRRAHRLRHGILTM